MKTQEIINKLHLQSQTPATPDELDMIERKSGCKLPESFRELWLSIGGTDLNLRISKGPMKDKYVASFYHVQQILQILEDDLEKPFPTLPQVMPFGDDFMGNTFFINCTEYAGPVLVSDISNQKAYIVAESFDEFLEFLER